MGLKTRKGDTLIELLVATALFILLLASVMFIPTYTNLFSNETMKNIVNISDILNFSAFSSSELNSAARMTPVDPNALNPNSVNSFSFKRSYNSTTGGSSSPVWTIYTVSGNALVRNSTTMVDSLRSFLSLLPNGTNYYYITIKSRSGEVLATNYGGVAESSGGYNDYTNPWWNISIVFSYKGYPFVINGMREVSYINEEPTLVTYNSPFYFNQAMDTLKYGTWNSDFSTVTAPSQFMSNYLGYAMKFPVQITGSGGLGTLPSVISNSLHFALYDPISQTIIKDANLKVYVLNTLSMSTYSLSDASITYNSSTGEYITNPATYPTEILSDLNYKIIFTGSDYYAKTSYHP